MPAPSNIELLDHRRTTPVWTTITQFGILRSCAVLGTLAMLCNAAWASATAVAWSARAPLWWRAQLLLIEGGIPLLFATGFTLAAWRTPRARRLGWGLVGAVLMGLVLWSWVAVTGEAA